MYFSGLGEFVGAIVELLGFGFLVGGGFFLSLCALDRIGEKIKRSKGELMDMAPSDFFGKTLEIELDCGKVYEQVRIAPHPKAIRFTESIGKLEEMLPVDGKSGERHFLPVAKVKRITKLT